MLHEIKRRFPVTVWKPHSSFATLIHTILSQNTNDKNSNRAMKELRKNYKINPQTLANADITDIACCIRSAGLYESKAAFIHGTSREIVNEFGGRLNGILSLPYPDAKRVLTSLPGVGPKTADILLAFVAGHPIIPVDTHVTRVSTRLGISSRTADYEDVSRRLESLTSPNDRVSIHLSIIRFGREVCKARKPLCKICPLNATCPSSTVNS